MRPSSRFIVIAATCASAALFFPGTPDAATIRLYREGAVPDPRVVAAILGKPKKIRLRGMGPAIEVAEPFAEDGGETISEDEIRANAAAAVAAWEQKTVGKIASGDGRSAAVPGTTPPAVDRVVPTATAASVAQEPPVAAGRPAQESATAATEAPVANPQKDTHTSVAAKPRHENDRAVESVIEAFEQDAARARARSKSSDVRPESGEPPPAAALVDAPRHSDKLALADNGDAVTHPSTSAESPTGAIPSATDTAVPARIAKAPSATHERPTVLAVLIRFGNDSARITPAARAPLDAIASGIKLAGYERKIVVEGHANATGSAARNLELSELRARAVKQYLVEQHGIPAEVLVTRGLGSTMPLDGRHPAAPENRRVQFRAIDA